MGLVLVPFTVLTVESNNNTVPLPRYVPFFKIICAPGMALRGSSESRQGAASVQELFVAGASGEKKNAWPPDDGAGGGGAVGDGVDGGCWTTGDWTTGCSTPVAGRSGMPSMAHILAVLDQL